MNKLSIIVPVYNDENNIERCINSLLNQTIEVNIIVIDDGSTDSTSTKVNQLLNKHSNITYYKKENEGIATARNFGVSKVETEYFGFLDSDDSCEPNTAELMLNQIEKDNSDICFSNFNWIYENGSIKKTKDTYYLTKKDTFIKMFATLWNKIYRTEWFRSTNLSFPDGYRYEDASLLYRLVPYMDKISYVDDYLINYYQRQGSITHTFNVYVNDMIEVFKGIVKHYKDNHLYEEYKDEIEYVTTRFFLGNSYLRTCRIKDKKIQKEILDKSWKFLNDNFPNFKQNKYLNNPGRKNKYFKNITEKKFYNNVLIFKTLYSLGILK